MASPEKTNLQTRASEVQHEARKQLIELFETTPLPPDQLLVNLALYMRSPVVAKLLYVDELYRKIVNIPGVIMEFGVWWGANLALFQSLRAVHEPYNYARKVIGFDTFEGYPQPATQDGAHELAAQGQYTVGGGQYLDHLRGVLDYHEVENVLSQVVKYELVQGDATQTVPDYLRDNPHTVISLAYFDMQLYEPTKAALEAIRPHLVRGSVIAMDELNCGEFPGETVAVREVLGLDRYTVRRSTYLPDRTYFIVD